MSARSFAALAAASIALASPPVAAQDPPPPLVPPDAPPAPEIKPDAPPPPAVPAPEQAPAPPAPIVPLPVAPSVTGSAASRTLHGHTFIMPFTVESAFVTSRVGIAAELGHQWEPGVLLSTPANVGKGTYDRSTGITTEHLDLGIAVNDRVELGFDALYSAFLGSDIASTIAFGSHTAWEIHPGLRLRVWSNESTQIGLHLYGNFGSGTRQNPLGVLAEVAAEANKIAGDMSRTGCLAAGDLSCLFTSEFDAQAASKVTRSVAAGGVAFTVAHAFHERFGVQASAGIEAGYAWVGSKVTGDVGSAPIAVSIAVAPSLDFGPKVPLSLMAEYRFRFIAEPTVSVPMTVDAGTAQTLQSSISGGLYYTGRRELSLGALVSGVIANNSISYSTGSTPLAPTRIFSGQVSARYYF